jgi:hypothetical protein
MVEPALQLPLLEEFDKEPEASNDEEQELDVDNIDLPMLIKDNEDYEYLQSLTELEWEAILGECIERLKNEIDMKKSLGHAKRQGAAHKNMNVVASLEVQDTTSSAAVVVTGTAAEWEDVGLLSPISTEWLGLESKSKSIALQMYLQQCWEGRFASVMFAFQFFPSCTLNADA